MQLSLIAAVGISGQLAWKGEIPFYHPEDMAHFKKTTIDHCIIMGRKTMQSLPCALKDRKNIFISHKHYQREGFIHCTSLEQAFKYCPEKCFIIGGAELYSRTIDICQTLYLSIFDYDGPGDVFFPEYQPLDWKTLSTRKFSKQEAYPSFTLKVMERISTCHF